MLYCTTKAALATLVLLGVFSFSAAQAAMPKPKTEYLQGQVRKQSTEPLNRVSMVGINAFNLFLFQGLIHQHHVGIASTRLSIINFPSNFTPNPNQAKLLTQHQVKEEIVSATEGDVVNQKDLFKHSDIRVTHQAGKIRLEKTSPIAMKNNVHIYYQAHNEK